MPTQATVGYGSILEAETGASGSGVYTRIAEVVSFNGPNDDVSLVDATNMDSANARREFIYGLVDGGTVDMEVNWLPQAPSQKLLRTDVTNKITRNYRITLPDTAGTTIVFPAQVQSIKRSAQIDAVMRKQVSLKVSGNVIWNPA
jgi:predicted secreted protein